MADTEKTLVANYDIQHWLSFDGETTWVRVTEDKTFTPSRDASTYSTSYLDRKNQTDYALGIKDSIEFEVDALGGGEIQKLLAAHEDDQNVPAVYCRTVGYDFAKGAPAPATARVAKKAECVINESPMTEAVNEPGVFNGTISITGEYVAGTFDETTKKFTAAGAGA